MLKQSHQCSDPVLFYDAVFAINWQLDACQGWMAMYVFGIYNGGLCIHTYKGIITRRPCNWMKLISSSGRRLAAIRQNKSWSFPTVGKQTLWEVFYSLEPLSLGTLIIFKHAKWFLPTRRVGKWKNNIGSTKLTILILSHTFNGMIKIIEICNIS
jgi:hypothetical protein